MFGMPQATPYDLNFRLLGIPVRVVPWFWLIAVLLGPVKDPGSMLLWVACMFASILVHEMGHGLMGRRFGHRPEIALYGMGGLCSSGADEQTLGQRLAVLFAGPGAQFLLLGAMLLVAVPWLGITWTGDVFLAQTCLGLPPTSPLEARMELSQVAEHAGPKAFLAFYFLFQINFLWALLNLLPIYPLDGGQIAMNLWSRLDPVHGARRTHILSMVTAGCLAAYALAKLSPKDGGNGLFRVLFFGQFAFLNYQLLKAHHQKFVQHGADDADWWKR